MIEPIEYLLIF